MIGRNVMGEIGKIVPLLNEVRSLNFPLRSRLGFSKIFKNKSVFSQSSGNGFKIGNSFIANAVVKHYPALVVAKFLVYSSDQNFVAHLATTLFFFFHFFFNFPCQHKIITSVDIFTISPMEMQ